MQCYVKSYDNFSTVAQAPLIGGSLVVDSAELEASSVTAAGNTITQRNVGDWLIADGTLYLIKSVTPQQGKAALTLVSPLEAFNRKIEQSSHYTKSSVGAFMQDVLNALWWYEEDPVYALRYLRVSNFDTTPFVPPELDNAGCFQLSEYVRLMRKSQGVTLQFVPDRFDLRVQIVTLKPARRQIVFGDGHSQLVSASFGGTAVAKITVLQDVPTGEKLEDGTAVTERVRRNYYLAEDGGISDVPPARRASGRWETITAGASDDLAAIEAKVEQAFASNKTGHKLEFFSDEDIPVMVPCGFNVYGDLLEGQITYKRKSISDNRIFYRSGSLAVTATEKLRRL